MDDDEIKATLHAMWTPEMLDRFEADVRKLLQDSPQYKDQPEEQEKIIASLRQRAEHELRRE